MMEANNNEKALDEIPAEKYTSEGRTATVVMECSQEADVGIHDRPNKGLMGGGKNEQSVFKFK